MELRNFQQEIRELANKYALSIKEGRLKENSVEELFREYRKTISDIIRDFPKCDFQGVPMLCGLSAEDMPYKKELIQAKILRSLLGQEIILLPRFMTNTLNLILGSQLKNGSVGDAVVFLPNAEKYIEFKVCKEAYIGEQINKSMPLIDCIFVILSDVEFIDSKQYRHYLEKRSRKWNIKDSLEIIVCDMQGKYAMKLERNKETSSGLPFNSPSSRRSRRWTDEQCSSTTALLYLHEMKNVNKQSFIYFPEYFKCEESLYSSLPSEKYYLLFDECLRKNLSREDFKTSIYRIRSQGYKIITPAMIEDKENDGKAWLRFISGVLSLPSLYDEKTMRTASKAADNLCVSIIPIVL